MSGEETDLIHIDPETKQHKGGGADESLQSLPLAMLVKVQKFNGTSLPKCLPTKDIVREVFKETVGNKYQLSTVDILNDREFIIEMDPPCTYSLAAIKLQKLMTWLSIEVQVSCTMADSDFLHEVHCQREERRQETKARPEGSEPQAMTSMGIHSNNLLDQMVDRMMGQMNQEVRRLESLIQQRPDVTSIPSVCNQSNATERVIGP